MKLRKTLRGQISQAIEYLKQFNNLVAKTTVQLLESGEVKCRFFNTTSEKALKAHYKDWYPKKRSQYLPKTKDEYMQEICEGADALFFSPNLVYFKHNHKSVKDLAADLVHECNHYLNDADPFETNDEMYTYEYKAYVASHMAFGIKMTRGKLNEVKQEMLRRKVEHTEPANFDPSDVIAKSIFYRNP